jgi:uncharacterized glyoxalase superfamily protein PhnB
MGTPKPRVSTEIIPYIFYRDVPTALAWLARAFGFTEEMIRNPSCLISCSHSLPDGSVVVFAGKHGAMNPAGKVRCNMRINELRQDE